MPNFVENNSDFLRQNNIFIYHVHFFENPDNRCLAVAQHFLKHYFFRFFVKFGPIRTFFSLSKFRRNFFEILKIFDKNLHTCHRN